MEKLYGSKELCEMFGYKTSWWLVKVLREAGIKIIKLGPRKIVVQESEVKRYVEMQRIKLLTTVRRVGNVSTEKVKKTK